MKKWAAYIAVALGVVGVKTFMEADRDETGAIVSEGSIDAFAIRVGDCFDDSSEEQITDLPGVPCSQPHDNEVYAVFDVDLTEFPENDGMSELAFDACLERFEPFVGKDYESSSLDILTLYPSPESWRRDDREIVCAVYDVELKKLTGSVAGLAL